MLRTILFTMLLLVPSLVHAMEMDIFQDMIDIIHANDFASVEKFFDENRTLYLNDPEYYVLLLNYALAKGRQNQLVIAKGEPQEGDLELRDDKTGDVVGFMGERLNHDAELIVNSITETQHAQQFFQNRLDIHFGIVHLAFQIERWDIVSIQLIDILRTSNAIQHDWKWGSINSMEGEPQGFMLENVQAKVFTLFQRESQETDTVVETVSKALIREFPEVIYGYSNLGVLYMATQQYDVAEQYLQQALHIDPHDEIVRGNLDVLKKRREQQHNK